MLLQSSRRCHNALKTVSIFSMVYADVYVCTYFGRRVALSSVHVSLFTIFKADNMMLNFYNTTPLCIHNRKHSHTHTHTRVRTLTLYIACIWPVQCKWISRIWKWFLYKKLSGWSILHHSSSSPIICRFEPYVVVGPCACFTRARIYIYETWYMCIARGMHELMYPKNT